MDAGAPPRPEKDTKQARLEVSLNTDVIIVIAVIAVERSKSVDLNRAHRALMFVDCTGAAVALVRAGRRLVGYPSDKEDHKVHWGYLWNALGFALVAAFMAVKCRYVALTRVKE